MKDGGPAFPTYGADEDRSAAEGTLSMYLDRRTDGLSLRDYFAGQALIGILGSRKGFLVDVGTENAPAWAYQVADAMLAEREKGGGK